MSRPLTFLVTAIAVACVALFALLPMTKIVRHGATIEAVSAEVTSPSFKMSDSEAAPRLQAPASNDAAESGAPDVDGEMTVRIDGQVSNASGETLTDLEILLEAEGVDNNEVTSSSLFSDQYGNFTLQLVPARQYRLEIAAAGAYAGYRLEAFTASTAEALQRIVLERVELVDVDGLIVDTDFAPVADFELNLQHQSLDYPSRAIRSDSSGYFSLKGFPAGEWSLATSQPDYFQIKGLKLQPGEYRNLTLMIDRGSYHLAGWVRDSWGSPLAEVIITLKSDFSTDEYHSFSYRSVATDANGTFEFGSLGGHPMTLGIYANGFKTYIRQHEFQSFSDTLEIVLEP